MADERILTTKAAGELLAKLKGRPTPYKSSTVRRWVNDEGLESDLEGDRISIREDDLISWATDAGYLPKDFQSGAASGKAVSKPAVLTAINPAAPVVVKPAASAAPDLDDDEDQGDEPDGDADDDVELVPCPECGELVAISPDTVRARCPGCGEELDVFDEGDEEDAGDDEDGEDEGDEADDEKLEPEPDPDPTPKRSLNPFRLFGR